MKSQRIETGCAQAELVGRKGVLVLETLSESVTVSGEVTERIDITLLLNERELFSGSTTELEAALEATRALLGLRDNHIFRQVLAQLADSSDATAVLRYLNQR